MLDLLRIVCESVSRVGWTNELLQLVRGPVTSAFRLRHTQVIDYTMLIIIIITYYHYCHDIIIIVIILYQSLFTALDNVRDIVQITDSDHKVTWVNQTAEKVWNIVIEIIIISHCNYCLQITQPS